MKNEYLSKLILNNVMFLKYIIDKLGISHWLLMRASALIKPWAYPVKSSQEPLKTARKIDKPQQKAPKTLIHKTTSKSSNLEAKPVSLLKDKNCIEAQGILESGENYEKIDNETLDILPLYLNQLSQTCARNKDLDQAEKAKQLKTKANSETERRKILITSKPKDFFQDDFDDDLSVSKSQNRLEKFDQETNFYYQQLQEKQAKELNEFERVWAEEKAIKYRKSSPELLQQKYIYQQLILSKKYPEAKQKAREIEMREQAEVMQAQALMNRDYQYQKMQLLQKHKREQDIYVSKRSELRQTYEMQIKKEKEVEEKQQIARERGKPILLTSRTKPTEETGIQRFTGPFHHLKSTEEKIEINPLLPNLVAPSESIRNTRNMSSRTVYHEPQPLGKPELNKAIWGNVDINHRMFLTQPEPIQKKEKPEKSKVKTKSPSKHHHHKSNLPNIHTKLDQSSLSKLNRIQKGWSSVKMDEDEYSQIQGSNSNMSMIAQAGSDIEMLSNDLDTNDVQFNAEEGETDEINAKKSSILSLKSMFVEKVGKIPEAIDKQNRQSSIRNSGNVKTHNEDTKQREFAPANENSSKLVPDQDKSIDSNSFEEQRSISKPVISVLTNAFDDNHDKKENQVEEKEEKVDDFDDEKEEKKEKEVKENHENFDDEEHKVEEKHDDESNKDKEEKDDIHSNSFEDDESKEPSNNDDKEKVDDDVKVKDADDEKEDESKQDIDEIVSNSFDEDEPQEKELDLTKAVSSMIEKEKDNQNDEKQENKEENHELDEIASNSFDEDEHKEEEKPEENDENKNNQRHINYGSNSGDEDAPKEENDSRLDFANAVSSMLDNEKQAENNEEKQENKDEETHELDEIESNSFDDEDENKEETTTKEEVKSLDIAEAVNSMLQPKEEEKHDEENNKDKEEKTDIDEIHSNSFEDDESKEPSNKDDKEKVINIAASISSLLQPKEEKHDETSKQKDEAKTDIDEIHSNSFEEETATKDDEKPQEKDLSIAAAVSSMLQPEVEKSQEEFNENQQDNESNEKKDEEEKNELDEIHSNSFEDDDEQEDKTEKLVIGNKQENNSFGENSEENLAVSKPISSMLQNSLNLNEEKPDDKEFDEETKQDIKDNATDIDVIESNSFDDESENENKCMQKHSLQATFHVSFHLFCRRIIKLMKTTKKYKNLLKNSTMMK